MTNDDLGGLVLFGVVVAIGISLALACIYCGITVLRIRCSRQEPLAENENPV